MIRINASLISEHDALRLTAKSQRIDEVPLLPLRLLRLAVSSVEALPSRRGLLDFRAVHGRRATNSIELAGIACYPSLSSWSRLAVLERPEHLAGWLRADDAALAAGRCVETFDCELTALAWLSM